MENPVFIQLIGDYCVGDPAIGSGRFSAWKEFGKPRLESSFELIHI